MGRGILRTATALIALLAATPLLALDHNGLRQRVETFMRDQIPALQARYGARSRIEFGLVAMDSRLNLPDCPQPLALSLREQNISSRVNVQVSCNAGMGWNVYVPVDVAIFAPVVTSAGPLARGATVAATDIQLVETDITRLSGQYLSRPEEAVGLSLKRQLSVGQPITADMLTQPVLIKRGDAVTITVESDGLNVKMPGVALSDGRLGEQIRVKNSNSARVVDALVVEAGLVKVTM